MSTWVLRWLFFLGFLTMLVKGFWVGPLWGYRDREEETKLAVDIVEEELRHKYPAWMAPADIDGEY